MEALVEIPDPLRENSGQMVRLTGLDRFVRPKGQA